MDDQGLHRIRAADGRDLYYELGGATTPSGHLPVVFLHGSLANRLSFRKVRPLLESSRRSLATVLRGRADEDHRTLPSDMSVYSALVRLRISIFRRLIF